MIEIQCSSCHTRYRIDERVLPADTPTFKCSRCGHVFTTDPLTAKKVSAEPSSKPQAPRPATPRGNPKSATPPPATAKPEDPVEAPKTIAAEEQSALAKPAAEAAPKATPIKPYIRNQRPTVFDRNPEPPPSKSPLAPSSPIDADSVARMKAAVETPKSNLVPEPPSPRPPEPPTPPTARAVKHTQADDEGENLEFDFNDEQATELGDDPGDDDAPTAAQRWSVGDDDAAEPPPLRHSGFGSGELDPEFSRGEPAPIGRGTIPQYAAMAPIEESAALPDDRAYLEHAEFRSARSFLGVFLMVAVVFLVLTGIIHGIPSASAELLRRMPVIGREFEQPVVLENLLSVAEVQSNYQTMKGGHTALVITGVVKNHAPMAFHTVQIGVRLLDAEQHDLARSAVYCGTTLSPRMIGEMTPHELEFLQKLAPPSAFKLDPGQAAPFLMVFIDPPRDVHHVAVAVARAAAPGTPQTSQAGS
jgi:predicted Zn finger-like uncharacterized protein